jgi:2'-5' RNA ligase
MARTIPADFIGKENLGYALVALSSENTKRKIAELLDELNANLPGVLWLMPPEQLHITLCEIIQPKTYSQDKTSLYNLHKDQYEDIPARVLSNVPKFTISFDIIEASPQAIIVRASDANKLNDIRANLVANMQLPDETRTPPDITHSSIARYLQEVDLENIQSVIAQFKISIDEEITEFKLIKNLIPPLQKYEVLKTFSLIDS